MKQNFQTNKSNQEDKANKQQEQSSDRSNQADQLKQQRQPSQQPQANAGQFNSDNSQQLGSSNGASDRGKQSNQYGTIQHEQSNFEKDDSYDLKDGIQGQRSMSPSTKQEDDRLHESKNYQSHDPKDGIQGESNNLQQNQQNYGNSQQGSNYGQKEQVISNKEDAQRHASEASKNLDA